MKNNIKEKYRAQSVDEIFEQIEVDKVKYNATEQILKKKIKRKMPLFWKKDYVYLVEYEPDTTPKRSIPTEPVQRKIPNSDEKKEILEFLNQSNKEQKEEFKPRQPLSDMIEVATENKKTTSHNFTKYRERLLDAEVKEEIVEKILLGIKRELMEIDYENEEKVTTAMVNQMTALMGETYHMDLLASKKLVLIGPTGVGKTTTIGKLAAILKLSGRKVGLITTDIYRMGAEHQLNEYAKIVKSTMEVAKTPFELEQAIYYFENVEKVDHILIDTVGRSPMDAGNIEDIKTYLSVAKPDHISLVLSCTQKEKDIYKIIENYEEANVNSLIFTKLDETLNHGVIMNVIADGKANVSFIANGQRVPQDIYIANTDKLSNKILGGVDDFERPSL